MGGREDDAERNEVEIEITPRMIEVGVDQLLEYSISFDDPSEVVRRVLIACLSATSVRVVQNST